MCKHVYHNINFSRANGKQLKYWLWTELCLPPISLVDVLTPNVMVFGGEPLENN